MVRQTCSIPNISFLWDYIQSSTYCRGLRFIITAMWSMHLKAQQRSDNQKIHPAVRGTTTCTLLTWSNGRTLIARFRPPDWYRHHKACIHLGQTKNAVFLSEHDEALLIWKSLNFRPSPLPYPLPTLKVLPTTTFPLRRRYSHDRKPQATRAKRGHGGSKGDGQYFFWHLSGC